MSYRAHSFDDAENNTAVQSHSTVTREVEILQEKQKTNFVHCILYGTVTVHVSVTSLLVSIYCFELHIHCRGVRLVSL